jgi:hypothetical protein
MGWDVYVLLVTSNAKLLTIDKQDTNQWTNVNITAMKIEFRTLKVEVS